MGFKSPESVAPDCRPPRCKPTRCKPPCKPARCKPSRCKPPCICSQGVIYFHGCGSLLLNSAFPPTQLSGRVQASLRSSNDCLTFSKLDISSNIEYSVEFYELVMAKRFLPALRPEHQIVKRFSDRSVHVWPPRRAPRRRATMTDADPDDDAIEDHRVVHVR